MSQNNSSTVYAGIDVAKASLQLDWNGDSVALPNDAKGHAKLLRLLGKDQAMHVVLEATGGYEQPVVRALRSAGIPVSVVEPARVRWFAKSKGMRAKTDPIDAAMIRLFGETHQPEATPPLSADQSRLAALVSRRNQLVELQTAETNHAEHYEDAWICRQNRALLKAIAAQIAECEKAIGKLIASNQEMRDRSARVQQLYGIGPCIAATLQAFLPELGSSSDESIGALVGVVPFNQDSGKWAGQRRIAGGRTAVRCALYMAALTASRCDPIFKALYQRLTLRGKKPKVALVAVIRKLVLLLNRILRNPDFVLRTSV